MRNIRLLFVGILFWNSGAWAGEIGVQRLLAVGGSGYPPRAMTKFCGWAGGANGRILYLPWGSLFAEEEFERFRKALAECRAAITMVPPTMSNPDDLKNTTDSIRSATALFLSGGNQNRILDLVEAQNLRDLLTKLYETGIPFGGTSAGTAAMSSIALVGDGGNEGPAPTKIDPQLVRIRKGLGFIANSVFDQHFLARPARFIRLMGVMAGFSEILGFAVDESTAMAIEGNQLGEVIGESQVLLWETVKAGKKLSVEILNDGDVWDLVKHERVQPNDPIALTK